MANYITIPYYYFWPIAFISFVLVFFLSTNTKVTLNKIYDINMTNYTNYNLNDLSLFKNQNEKNITETCKHFLNDVNDQKEIYLINKFNLTIKITVFILFGISVLSIGFFYYFLYIMYLSYYDYTGNFCKDFMQEIFSCENNDENKESLGFSVYSIIIIIICLGIIFLSAFSIYFSLEIKDKMILYCNFELGEDYDIDFWIASKVLLGIIIVLYFFEISLCVYSICFEITLYIKKRKKNENNPDNKINLFT